MKFRAELSLPLRTESEDAKTVRKFGREFNPSLKDIKSFYNQYLVWLGRQDSNLGSRDQRPLPYRLATPQFPLGDVSAIGSKAAENRPADAH